MSRQIVSLSIPNFPSVALDHDGRVHLPRGLDAGIDGRGRDAVHRWNGVASAGAGDNFPHEMLGEWWNDGKLTVKSWEVMTLTFQVPRVCRKESWQKNPVATTIHACKCSFRQDLMTSWLLRTMEENELMKLRNMEILQQKNWDFTKGFAGWSGWVCQRESN